MIVDGDAERLRQVIDNLIGNALQHTPRGSAVTVTVPDQAGQAQLTVADSGPGLTADQASRVFERFYRTDRARTRARGGTGLGLSIAAALAAAHAGTITVDTQPGRGRRLPGQAAAVDRWSARRPAAPSQPDGRLAAGMRGAAAAPCRRREPHSPPQRDRKAWAIDYRAAGQPARPAAYLGGACRSPRRRHGDQPVSIPGPAPGLAARSRAPAAGQRPGYRLQREQCHARSGLVRFSRSGQPGQLPAVPAAAGREPAAGPALGGQRPAACPADGIGRVRVPQGR